MAKFERIVTPKGTAVYPHLHAPDYEFNAAGIFQTKLRVTEADAAGFMAKVKKVYKAYAKANGMKLRKAGLPWEEGDEENPGTILIKAKMKHKVTPKNSDAFEQTPVIMDAGKNELDAGLKIGGGSTLKLACVMVPYDGFGGGISLRLLAVQVLELVTWGSDFGFDEEEGFEGDYTDDPFAETDDAPESDDDDDDFGDDEDDEYDSADF